MPKEKTEIELMILYRSATPDLFTKGGDEISDDERKFNEKCADLQKDIYG